MEDNLAVPVSEQSLLRYYWDNFRVWRQDSLLIYPILFMISSFALVWITREIDVYLTNSADLKPWWMASSNIILTVTSSVSSSLLTLLAIGFSISLFSLQMATQQYSPRVTSIFLRSAITKLTVSLIIGTWVYSFILMIEVLRSPIPEVSIISLLTIILLTLVSLMVFIYFMKSVLVMIRITNIITIIEDTTQKSINVNLHPQEEYTNYKAVSLEQPNRVIEYARLPDEIFTNRYDNGVLTRLDRSDMVQIASQHDCVLRVIPKFGDPISVGDPIVEIYGENPLQPQRVLKGVFIEPEREIYQDPAYGIRILVDIALQALSVGINAPTTAHQVIIRLTNLLAIVAERPQHTGAFADRGGHLRLLHAQTTWEEFVNLAYEEIIHYGSGDLQVRKSLAASFDYLLARVPETLKLPLMHQKAKLQLAEVKSSNKKY